MRLRCASTFLALAAAVLIGGCSNSSTPGQRTGSGGNNATTRCGGGGIPRQCGANPDSGVCTPTQCDHSPRGKFCGMVDDGCGSGMDCGGCPMGFTCGGAGTPNMCGVAPDAGSCKMTCTPPGGT